jgi:uncharacterized damage-inducible protein DinB
MHQAHRKGAIGALMDEYERAAAELKRLVENIDEEDFSRIIDPQASDENCRSIQTIMSHVVGAGRGYAADIREAFSIATERRPKRLLSQRESLEEFDAMLAYTAQTLDGKWEMPEPAIQGTAIHSRWGPKYDLEQLLEHAIVHILRHRRQIEKFSKRISES